jgi:hypothetical protein
LGRGRAERQATTRGYRHGDEEGTRKTAAGVRRVPVPQVRGLEAPDRSPVWPQGAQPSDRRTTRIVERGVGGRAPREMAVAFAKA